MSVSNEFWGFSSITSLTLGGTMIRRFDATASYSGDGTGGTNKIDWSLSEADFEGFDSPLVVFSPFASTPVYAASRTVTFTVSKTSFDPGSWTVRGTMQGVVGEVAGTRADFSDFPIVRRIDKGQSPYAASQLVSLRADNISGEALQLAVIGTIVDLASLPEHMADQLALSYTLSA